MPLYMRYTICVENKSQIEPDEIYVLYPRLTAKGLQIKLFFPAYKKMLALSHNVNLPNSDDGRNILPDMAEILPLFSEDEQKQILQILQDNKRLPQEILSYPVLAD